MSQRSFELLLVPILVALVLCGGIVGMDVWRSLTRVSQPAAAPGPPPIRSDATDVIARRTPERPIDDGTSVPADVGLHPPTGKEPGTSAEVTFHRPMGGHTGAETEATPRPTSRDPAMPFPLPVPSRPPSPERPRTSLLDRVGVKEIADDVYAVTGAEAWAALDDPEHMLAEVAPTVRLLLSSDTWPRYEVRSRAVDGVLTAQGFIVTDPKHAQRAGLQMGDTIVRVNGRPVDGLTSLFAISRRVRQTGAQSAVRVDIQRQGSLLTKTYALQ